MAELRLEDINTAVKEIIQDNHDAYNEEEIDDLLRNHPDYVHEQIRRLNLINNGIDEENSRLFNDRTSRKWYGRLIFSFVSVYILAVLCVIISDFHLSEKIKIALLGSANINIIGLLMGVVRYLFPNQKQ